MKRSRRGETVVIMAFDSRWEREHNTLQSQLQLLDGLDVGAPWGASRASRQAIAISIWLRLAVHPMR